jgi:hypothetical protein
MNAGTSWPYRWQIAGVIFLVFLMGGGCSSRMKQQEHDLSLLLTEHRIGRLIVMGVVDIPEKGKQPSVSARLSDLAVNHFVSLNDFGFIIVVKRQDEIGEVTKKLGINLWDITDREKAKAVGGFLGVDAIILGKHHISKQQMGAAPSKGEHVIFQIVDVGTGQLIWSDTTTLTE